MFYKKSFEGSCEDLLEYNYPNEGFLAFLQDIIK